MSKIIFEIPHNYVGYCENIYENNCRVFDEKQTTIAEKWVWEII